MLHIADLRFHSCQKYKKFTDILFCPLNYNFRCHSNPEKTKALWHAIGIFAVVLSTPQERTCESAAHTQFSYRKKTILNEDLRIQSSTSSQLQNFHKSTCSAT